MEDDEVQTRPFLAHLGLDAEADERAIRRAYAQRLKRIDQVNEAQTFQDLREAYETALRWCAWQRQRPTERAAEQVVEALVPPLEATSAAVTPAEASPAAEPALPAPDALPEATTVSVVPAAECGRAVFEASPDPDVLAEAVLRGFVARRDRGFATEDEAQQALDHALADDRLVNLEARAMFEWRVACLLAEGWRPGHEFLFGPASKTFHWEQERRALAVFGRVGAALNAAIQERLMFFGQGPLDFNAQRQLIQRLRRDEMPDAGELVRSVPTLHLLAQRYPQWLHMITSQSNFNRWTEAFKSIPAAQREAFRQRTDRQPAPSASAAKEPFQKQPSSFNPWWLVFVIVLLFGVFTRPSKPHLPPLTSAPWTTPAHSDGFKPMYDLSPSDPVATQPAGWPPASKEATPWVPSTLRAPSAPDPASRQSPVEAELEKLAADPVAKTLRDEAGRRVQAGTADSSSTQSADAYLEQQRKRLHAVEGTLPELGGSLLSSPDTGTAPRLSYDLTQPADAASAVPSWIKPDKQL